MEKALFINGVFRTVLEEIVTAQQGDPGLICYLQPYMEGRMKLLAEETPTNKSPMPLYVSLSDDLGHICFTAEIVGWEDKQELDPDRLELLNRHIKQFQPSEEEIYLTVNGHKCTNMTMTQLCSCPHMDIECNALVPHWFIVLQEENLHDQNHSQSCSHFFFFSFLLSTVPCLMLCCTWQLNVIH